MLLIASSTDKSSVDGYAPNWLFPPLSSFQKNYSQVIASFLSDEQFGGVCCSPHGAFKVVRSNHVAPACRRLMFWHQQQFEHSHQPQVSAWKCLIIHRVATEELISNATLFIPGLYAAYGTSERGCQLLELLCPLRAAVWRSACCVMRLVSLCVWSASHWAAESLTNRLMSAPVTLVLSWAPNKGFSARSVSLQVCGSARLCCSFLLCGGWCRPGALRLAVWTETQWSLIASGLILSCCGTGHAPPLTLDA